MVLEMEGYDISQFRFTMAMYIFFAILMGIIVKHRFYRGFFKEWIAADEYEAND